MWLAGLFTLYLSVLCCVREVQGVSLVGCELSSYQLAAASSETEYSTSGASITVLPRWEFPVNVKAINIIFTQITVVPDGIFRDLPSLRKAWLTRNKLHTVCPHAFDDTSITIINFYGNQLTQVPDLSPLAGSLSRLIMSNNPISNNASLIMPPMRNLYKLTIMQCGLQQPPRISSSDSAVYSRLYLNLNKFGVLQPEDLGVPFRTVDLSNAEVEGIADTRSFAFSISTLYLNKNDLQDDGLTINSWAGFTSLRNLYLQHNHLTVFPNLTHLSQELLYLDFSYNQISGLTDGCLTNFSALGKLIFAGNQFLSVPDFSLADLPHNNNLQYLDFQSNDIYQVTADHLSRLNKLETLILSRNALVQFQVDYAFTPELRYLYLDQNPELGVSADLSDLDNLTLIFLDLTHSNITLPPLLTASRETLTRLQLGYNPLPWPGLRYYLQTFTALKEVHLQSSGLSGVPYLTDSVEVVDVEDNPLDCDKLCWLKTAEEERGLTVLNIEDLSCQTATGSYTTWDHITALDLCTVGTSTAPDTDVTTSRNLPQGVSMSDAVLSSQWGQQGAGAAMDELIHSCCSTGYESHPWWKVILTVPIQVTGVKVIGSVYGSHRVSVQVGDHTSSVGLRQGHEENKECVVAELAAQETAVLTCAKPISGQVISISVQRRSLESKDVSQLTLCDVILF